LGEGKRSLGSKECGHFLMVLILTTPLFSNLVKEFKQMWNQRDKENKASEQLANRIGFI
jgi:hypothetical protein